MKTSVAAVIVMVVLIAGTTAPAQVPLATLDEGVTEAGYGYGWYRRALAGHPPDKNKWETAAFNIRHGAFGWLTVALEGGIWNVEKDASEADSYRRYVIGAGVMARIWQYHDYTLVAGVHLSESQDHDREKETLFHKRLRNVDSQLLAERAFLWSNLSLCVSGGLAFASNTGRTYIWGTPDFLEGESSSNVGALLAIEGVAFEHFVGMVNLVIVEYLQPQVGIGVRF